MTGSVPPGPDIKSDLLVSVGTIVAALRAVANGDLSQRLDVGHPDTHPVGALALSVNSMVEALTEVRTASESYLAELSERIDMIERQREAIRSLSIPIIEVWTGVLCAPVVGVLDTMRAADVTNTLLTAVVQKKARHVIIDITGIEVMDTQSADQFLRIARAVTLLGAECALSGVHPNIARTIVHMGVDLQGLRTHRSMRDALKRCVQEVARRDKKRKRRGSTDTAAARTNGATRGRLK
jgi:rsbT co-antagonist protein RsbR